MVWKVRPQWPLLAVFAVSFLASFSAADSAMDRTVATLTATLFRYSNYLYLSEFHRQPTAIPLFDRFCGDSLPGEQLQNLTRDVSAIRNGAAWTFKCAPVKVVVRHRNSDGIRR